MKTNTAGGARALDAIVSPMSASGAEIRIYSGTQPGSGGAETTVLAVLPCSWGGAPFSSATVADPPVITGQTSGGKFAEDTSIDATGTATWYRLYYSGAMYFQGPIAELNLSIVNLVIGGSISITSFNVSLTGLVS